MRWQQDPYDQPDDDDPGDVVPDDDRRWLAMFTPQAPERLTAYWTASRLSYPPAGTGRGQPTLSLCAGQPR